MSRFCPPFTSIWRLYRHGLTPKSRIGLPSEQLPSVFNSSFHHLCLLTVNTMHKTADSQLNIPYSLAYIKSVPCFPPSNYSRIQWYFSPGRPRSGAYRQRVNRRLRLARKPVLDVAQFNKVVSQLPARFTADDLHNVLALENDSFVCLELFNWASKQHRFEHSVPTFHKTIQKLGIAGMIEEMYDVVDQVLARPNFGSEALYNTIIYYYTKARKLSRAVTVFKHMKKVENSDCKPSIKTYNLLFAAFLARGQNTYINHMYMGTMVSLFKQMINDGIEPDIFSLNAMIQGYVLSNHVNDALRIFHQMGVVYTTVPDSLTYNHLIYGLCAQSRTNNASELFNRMREKGFDASGKTYNSFVNALALVGEVDKALKYLWEMIGNRKSADFITYNTVLDEFCRKGRAAEALNLLKEFKEKRLVDEVAYNKLLIVLKDDFRVRKNHSCIS
ncbi:pentatricopeptide repeat-containing protein At2g27800, mitochondrial [Silene latifolia]|uniref:pentatricopeptide repeat-containing protein At2g27800, mitochondrial n=1 Tax=Silene latifolia TaxID=37657 RepID=UPI003D786258